VYVFYFFHCSFPSYCVMDVMFINLIFCCQISYILSYLMKEHWDNNHLGLKNLDT
jgi:hypothetical protein